MTQKWDRDFVGGVGVGGSGREIQEDGQLTMYIECGTHQNKIDNGYIVLKKGRNRAKS